MRIIFAASILLALAGCAQQRPRYSTQVIDRVLADAPYEAQPSKVVAAESAFARMAREDGQWTAFYEFSAEGAIIHGRNGPIDARTWLAAQANPEQAVQWGPRAVWLSCTGDLAVSRGRFVDPDGTVGTFVTVWQRQKNDEYKWTYDVGTPDDPQPAPAEKPSADEIVVTGMDVIQGHVADCRDPAAPPPPPLPIAAYPEGTRQGGGASQDGTLRWSWVQLPDGSRAFTSAILRDNAWETAARLDIPPAG